MNYFCQKNASGLNKFPEHGTVRKMQSLHKETSEFINEVLNATTKGLEQMYGVKVMK